MRLLRDFRKSGAFPLGERCNRKNLLAFQLSEGFKHSNRSNYHYCYQIAHSSHVVQFAPNAVSAIRLLNDNVDDPAMFPVGVFERRVFDGGKILTADEREWTRIRKFWIRDYPR